MKYGKVGDVTSVLIQSGFATGNLTLSVHLTYKEFLNILIENEEDLGEGISSTSMNKSSCG